MADYLPQATGNWTTTTWITAFANLSAFAGGNTPPTVIDDVYADGKTITINIDTAVQSIRTTTSPRTGGLAGGGFTINNGISLSANVIAGTTTCLTFAGSTPNTCTVVGSISGGTTTSTHGVNNSSTGTVNISGSVFGGAASAAYGVINASTGNVNLTGFAIGSTRGGSNSFGILNNSTGTVTVYGYVSGGGPTGTGNIGLVNSLNSGNLIVFGNVFGGGPGGAGQGLTANSGNTTIYGNVMGTVNQNWGIQTTNTANVTLFGNALGNGEAAFYHGSTGTFTVVGTVSGRVGNGAYNQSTGTINISGDVYAVNSDGARNTSTGTINITGNCFGGAVASVYGVLNNSTGTVTVVGNVSGGLTSASFGANNNSTGRVFINGSAIPSNVCSGANNNSTGLLYITRAVGNNFGLGTVGINSIVGAQNTQNGLMYVEQFEFGPRGQTPISGPVYILPSNRNTLTGYTTAVGTPVTYYNTLSVTGLLPPVSSVQAGVVYNVGNSVGTMAVPSASAVQSGVPVDNTVGVAALTPQTVWGYARLSATQVNSMGDRLRNAATTQSVGSQIASFNL
jgi:hypothetical protein